MKQLQLCLLSLAICAMPVFAQQAKNPVTDVLRESLAGRQKNIVAAAEAMPADKFGYKPTPEQMSFGHLVAHIIEANYLFCANAADVPEPKVAESKETDGKDKLISALKASFDFCGSALPKATDAKLTDTIEMFGAKKTRAFAAVALASSWSDHYGAEAMYLRLNGVLPPTAKKEKD